MKKTMKTALAALLAAVMLFLLVPFAVMGEQSSPFEDVQTTDYFYDAVVWAYSEGVTTGTTATKFAPDATCTRGQVVTFLWRAMGEPLPESDENPFSDVKPDDYYYTPVLWAVENGITTGTGADCFSPDVTCTNAHILTFIWRAMGEPDKTGEGEWYSDAYNWANTSGLLDKTYTGEYHVDSPSPRANVVTYLYRYLGTNRFTFYVLAGADVSQADGSEQRPFASIEAARDAVRQLDKKGYRGIDVRILPGEYYIKNTVKFTKADSGTEVCPIRYIAEDGVIITGGVTLTAKDFKAASGKTADYFPEDAKADIVMVDLTKYGITKDYVAAKFAQDDITYSTLVPLYINGAVATIARYPNEGYAAIAGGDIVVADENAEKIMDKYKTMVDVSDEVAERIGTWHDVTTVFTVSRHQALWRPNNYRILSVDGNRITMPYPRDWYNDLAQKNYTPTAGLPIVFENIPEELDVPGEYYVDSDAVLYIMKTDDWEDVHISLPVAESAFAVNDADYITLKNLVIESFENKAMTVDADNFTLDGCEVRGIGQKAISIKGNDATVKNCEFHDLSFGILTIEGGDCDTLTPSGSVVYNNRFHDWGQIEPFYEAALNLNGCGIRVAHNEIWNAGHEAITWEGNYHIVEYNDIHDVCNDTDDAGAVYSYNSYAHYGNVFRYNYIHDIGLRDEFLANINGYNYCGVSAIYWDGGKSGQTAEYNIIENVTGVGVSASGRDDVVTNNLFISCGWSATFAACYYQGTFGNGSENGGGKDHQGFSGRENNEAWQKAFPGLYRMKWDTSNPDPDDPDYFVAPAGNVLKDNYYYFDKANMNSMKWYGHMFTNEIHESVMKFSGDNIEEAVEGVNQTTYSSKRTHFTAAEAVGETMNITGITPEQFAAIGLTK